ncbi:MAG: hypothetical protein Ct9H300mP32_3250 [Verrucomicrobiota bacterium]|nr:MAG: hypothetical protein Ct9H300mP32_3250 [Verrucomicrobiota bacterium]
MDRDVPALESARKIDQTIWQSHKQGRGLDKVLRAANANFDADDKNSNEFGTLYEAVGASGLVLTNYNFPKMTFRGQVPTTGLSCKNSRNRWPDNSAGAGP